MNLVQWAIKHKIPNTALAELLHMFNADVNENIINAQGDSEGAVQSRVQLEASAKGLRLFRNNVGALKDSTGRAVRFGLANTSAAINKIIKSSDLIGIRPVVITGAHVGHTIGQFVSREVKHARWQYSGDEHEVAQLRWLQMVAAMGGDAKFCTDDTTL